MPVVGIPRARTHFDHENRPMNDTEHIEARNQAYYGTQRAATWYSTKSFVLPEEKSFFRDYSDELRGKRVLDIGIGAGRSTRLLLPLAGEYVGVDYSEAMVKEAMLQHPGARLETRDARDLSAYGDASFDVVMFSFNGLDCLAHEGRMTALSEICRVLRPGGFFAFSAHNRTKARVTPWSLKNLDFSKHPLRMWSHMGIYFTGIRNWMGSRAYATQTDEFELRHDSSNCYMAPTYHIDKASQALQLQKAGLQLEKIYDGEGKDADAGTADTRSSWIFYVGRKAAV